MSRRSGSSLVEVLVAIFVMGIGLIALLTLFPIGMLRMMRAIRDDACAQAARIGQANSILYGVRTDPTVIYEPGPPAIPDVFINPYKINPLTGAATGWKDADPFAESYAVLVDPIGYNSAAGNQRDWVGLGGTPGYLRRRTVSSVTSAVNLFKTYTLWDNIKFENTYDPATRPTTPGTPYKISAATNIFRDVRYSWAYLLRRPMASDASVVDCTVVVFDGRDALTLPEYLYTTSYFDPFKNTITVDYTNNVPPPIRPGNWLLDATICNNGAGTYASQHAYFYQVVSAEEIVLAGPPARTLTRYEVVSPLRAVPQMPLVPDPTSAAAPPPMVGLGTVIVLDGVAEIYEKGPARLP